MHNDWASENRTVRREKYTIIVESPWLARSGQSTPQSPQNTNSNPISLRKSFMY